MKLIEWEREKNKVLKETRTVSFEDVLFCIKEGFLLDTVPHPNADKYPNQKMFIVNIENYAYLVPFVETDQVVFLKTIIPSRKATKKYLRS